MDLLRDVVLVQGSRDDSDYSDDSSLMQVLMREQPVIGVVGPELVLREGKPPCH